MSDNRLAEALDVVARRLVANEWDGAADDIYLDDLDVSDEDARDIADRAWAIVHDANPSDDEYDAACAYLADRSGE